MLHGNGIGDDTIATNRSGEPRIKIEVLSSEVTPLRAPPFHAVDINGNLLAKKTGHNAVQRIGHIGDQHYVNLAEENVEDAKQRVTRGGQVLSFNAWQIYQPDSPVGRRPISKKAPPTIDDNVVPPFHQARREFFEERFRAAIGAWDSSTAKQRYTQNYLLILGTVPSARQIQTLRIKLLLDRAEEDYPKQHEQCGSRVVVDYLSREQGSQLRPSMVEHLW